MGKELELHKLKEYQLMQSLISFVSFFDLRNRNNNKVKNDGYRKMQIDR